jgi:hypothetical protein
MSHRAANVLLVWTGKNMESSKLFKKRHIGKTGIKTPMIVPSFSSTAFSRPSEMVVAINSMRSHLGASSLFSAYDISHYRGRQGDWHIRHSIH